MILDGSYVFLHGVHRPFRCGMAGMVEALALTQAVVALVQVHIRLTRGYDQ